MMYKTSIGKRNKRERERREGEGERDRGVLPKAECFSISKTKNL